MTGRSDWPTGPWDSEPDILNWTDEATGLACMMVRNHLGGWCGYVAVDPTHPAYGHGRDEVDIEAHGGLNFARAGSDGQWWFGFDCAHLGQDIVPAIQSPGLWTQLSARFFGPAQYRTVGYVRAECSRLAAQLDAQGRAAGSATRKRSRVPPV